MDEEFYIVLLSNSSMKYYPENTTGHFVTKLPRHIDLAGEWTVALVDIHIPLTFSTVPKNEEERRLKYLRWENIESIGPEGSLVIEEGEFFVAAGIYESPELLLAELNDHSDETHIIFTLNAGSRVRAEVACIGCTGTKIHSFELSPCLRKILGFENGKIERFELRENSTIEGHTPMNLFSSMPTNLLVYADICKPYITGDVYTRLLRNVAMDQTFNNYGRIVSKSFSQPIYIPLICPTFETIEIDLRSPTGERVPFDYGTLTVTLHFRKKT